MTRKLLMTASALVMGIIGLLLTFMPVEVLHYFQQTPSDLFKLVIQLMGALYIGFGILNWMAKTVLIRGIYAKPLVLGNLSHFLIGAITLVKLGINGNLTTTAIWLLTIFYVLFAIGFGLVSIMNPRPKTEAIK